MYCVHCTRINLASCAQHRMPDRFKKNMYLHPKSLRQLSENWMTYGPSLTYEHQNPSAVCIVLQSNRIAMRSWNGVNCFRRGKGVETGHWINVFDWPAEAQAARLRTTAPQFSLSRMCTRNRFKKTWYNTCEQRHHNHISHILNTVTHSLTSPRMRTHHTIRT